MELPHINASLYKTTENITPNIWAFIVTLLHFGDVEKCTFWPFLFEIFLILEHLTVVQHQILAGTFLLCWPGWNHGPHWRGTETMKSHHVFWGFFAHDYRAYSFFSPCSCSYLQTQPWLHCRSAPGLCKLWLIKWYQEHFLLELPKKSSELYIQYIKWLQICITQLSFSHIFSFYFAILALYMNALSFYFSNYRFSFISPFTLYLVLYVYLMPVVDGIWMNYFFFFHSGFLG